MNGPSGERPNATSDAPSNPPTRTVHCADALAWLPANPLASGCSILTSLPDVVEFRHRDAERWRPWFVAAAERVVRSTPKDGCAVFYQTDVKRDGAWVDKSFLVQQAALSAGATLLWHKIVCRAPAGQATFARPGYAHLLGFAFDRRDAIEHATADVLPELGGMSWPRAMGRSALEFVVPWLRDHAGCTTIVDPFCGKGTALAAANHFGLHAVGVELNPGRAAAARELAW